MMDYASASIHDLLDNDASYGSSSELGPYDSEQPSRECNMAGLMDALIVDEPITHTPPYQLMAE